MVQSSLPAANGGAARLGALARIMVFVVTIGFIVAVPTAASSALGAGAIRLGFDTQQFPANDDGSIGVPIGFSVNFNGIFDSVYINNNGDLSFGSPLSLFSPAGPVIAPFLADVETDNGGNPVRYGTGTVDGHPAFGATWPGVGCYHQTPTTALDYFQVVLIDRPDTGGRNFDIEFNYDQIQWDSGQGMGGDANCLGGDAPWAGYSDAMPGGDAFTLPGSGVSGAFLDGGPQSLVQHSLASAQSGRYVFQIRRNVNLVADSKFKTYGTPDPGFTFTPTGLRVGDALLQGATCGVTVEHVDAGTYPIVCSGAVASSYYTTSYTTGVLTVTAAATKLTVTPQLQSKLTPTAKLSRPDNGAPVAGMPITFLSGSTTICSATTDVTGTAKCSPLVISLPNLKATFSGTGNYLPSSGSASLI